MEPSDSLARIIFGVHGVGRSFETPHVHIHLILMTRMIGEKLSHYTILEEIHRGEKQVVYRARDERLNREVALKVLPAELVADPDRRHRFVAEAKAAAALEHPHIGVVHEIDETDGIAFITMELVRGPSLAHRLAEGPLPLPEALEIATGVGAALAYAHERGIVHRDLKPANVMLTETGHAKLIDFGLAKLLDLEVSPFLGETGEEEPPLQSTTREGRISGTVAFMSPEQARGGRVDARSDVFSFGLLLYTMLAGEPPFGGTSRIDTLHAVLHDPTPKLPVEARSSLQPIVERCLAKEPDRRYQSMGELLEDLRQARLRLEAGGTGRLGASASHSEWRSSRQGSRPCSSSAPQSSPPLPRSLRSPCSTSRISRATPSWTGCGRDSPTCS